MEKIWQTCDECARQGESWDDESEVPIRRKIPGAPRQDAAEKSGSVPPRADMSAARMRLPATCRHFPLVETDFRVANHTTAVFQPVQHHWVILGMPWIGHQRLLGLTIALLAWAHVRADHASTHGSTIIRNESTLRAAHDAPAAAEYGPLHGGAQQPSSTPRPLWHPVQSQTNGVSTLYPSKLFESWTR